MKLKARPNGIIPWPSFFFFFQILVHTTYIYTYIYNAYIHLSIYIYKKITSPNGNETLTSSLRCPENIQKIVLPQSAGSILAPVGGAGRFNTLQALVSTRYTRPVQNKRKEVTYQNHIIQHKKRASTVTEHKGMHIHEFHMHLHDTMTQR